MSEQSLPDKAAFDSLADDVNTAVRKEVARVFRDYDGPLNDAEKIVATLAGIVTAAGYWCGTWEPDLNANAFLPVLEAQFNEGRKVAHQPDTMQ